MNMKIFAMGVLTTLLATSALADMSTPAGGAMSGTTGPTANLGSTMSGAAVPSTMSGAPSGAMSGTAQPQ